MPNAQLTIDPAFRVAPADRRIFGSFVEHMGRCVYGGVYEPGHPTADRRGLRRDVLDLTRELGVSVVRYPGGTSSPATAGRTASARSVTARAGSTWPGRPSRQTSSGWTSS
ncbi:hypothetical protein V2I01_09730 [Micromonospora sp. BRA006-A]|nr:hypothetical protein [Micromonospora sp. BRA006-A]